jgi:hypothetical protein
MDATHFDRLTRVLAHAGSRRQTLLALLLGGVLVTPVIDDAAAGPGCKNVGKKCKKAKDCCSGVCKGKKGRKRCKAHDTGGCQAGQIQGTCGGTDVACTTSAGQPGLCNTTTGDAGYCGTGGDCFPCTKDADCREVCGSGAACVLCEGGCDVGTVCHGLSSCFGP